MTISIAVLHDVRRPERREALDNMVYTLTAARAPLSVFADTMPEGMKWSEFKTELALQQWQWSLSTDASHHVFLTDDLYLAPKWHCIIAAMLAAKPDRIIGLLSNSPRGVRLFKDGVRWYRTNSWVVGPAYVVPREKLARFLEWYKALPDNEEPKGRRWFNDDSALNEWNTFHGDGEAWHPLPTCIEHRHDMPSTVGHGDRYSRERVSWRAFRGVQDHEDGFSWCDEAVPPDVTIEQMCDPGFWRGDGPMVGLGEGL